jgi:hypothetical protein
MASKLVIERTGAINGKGLTSDARAILDSYLFAGKITSIENNLIDGVEHISLFFQNSEVLDSYLAEITALGEENIPGVTNLSIQRFDDI